MRNFFLLGKQFEFLYVTRLYHIEPFEIMYESLKFDKHTECIVGV